MSEKPLGRKAYGSIGHLHGSRRGEADRGVHEGQSNICTVKARPGDEVIVTSKLDGSNCSVAKLSGAILPLTRAGYHANSSPYKQHHLFAGWVAQNYSRFDALLAEGEQVVGEWLAQAHGTRYVLPHEPYVVFDLFSGTTKSGAAKRVLYDELVERTHAQSFVTPQLLHRGGAISIDEVLKRLEAEPCPHGTVGLHEGAVWRVERVNPKTGKVEFDFAAKFVRPEKVDGLYLPNKDAGQTEDDVVWNALS